MAEAVNHNYNEKLGRVTHYDMKLADGTILENVAAEDIQVTNASLAERHGGKKKKKRNMEESESIEEMGGCPSDDHGHKGGEMMMVDMGEQDIQTLADKAMDAIQALVAAAGGEGEMMDDEMMGDDMMDEGGAAHKDDPRNRRKEDPRTRPMEESKLHAFVRKTIQELAEGK